MNELVNNSTENVFTEINGIASERGAATGSEESLSKDILWSIAEIICLMVFGFVLVPLLAVVTIIRKARAHLKTENI